MTIYTDLYAQLPRMAGAPLHARLVSSAAIPGGSKWQIPFSKQQWFSRGSWGAMCLPLCFFAKRQVLGVPRKSCGNSLARVIGSSWPPRLFVVTLLRIPLLCSPLLCSTLLSSTLLYSFLLSYPLLYSTLLGSPLLYSILLCSALLYS